MSDDWIILIPEDPEHVPDADRRLRARNRFAEIAPGAEIEVTISAEIRFFDCGTNFRRVIYPTCEAEVSLNWWQERMDEDSGRGFKLAKYAMPCCRSSHTLQEMRYEWPQGFGHFSLEAMNPNVGTLDERNRHELEALLGTKLRVIYQHILRLPLPRDAVALQPQRATP